jgi:2-oxoglutarate dehydrogenase E2 component (dihydrolipoamide succinyltransferase)
MSDSATTVVVPMPHMGVSVEEGTVVEWLVAVGDAVSAEQPLCAIATDKVDTEVVAPADGVLRNILVQVDEDVAVGAPLAELEVGADAAADLEAAGGSEQGSPEPAPPAGQVVSGNGNGAVREVPAEPTQAPAPLPDLGLAERAAAGRDEFGRFDPVRAAKALLSSLPRPATGGKLASPIARRMAQAHGVDLGAVAGTGLRGRIRKSDVEAAIGTPRAEAPAPSAKATPASAAPQPEQLPAGYEDVPHEVVKTTRVRRVIAEHMVRSRQTAAHMTTEVDVDLTALTAARTEINEARTGAGEPKVSYLPFLARVACAALADHPRLNSTFLGDRTVLWQTVNLGVAVDTEDGLLVPVVRGCEQLDAGQIGAAIADLAERARSRKLTPDDLAGGTFTLSNPGSVGAVAAPAIINQPQVAVLGVPTIQRRAWVLSDESGAERIEVRPILRLAVTFDHRAVDGADATRFAVGLKERLESWGPRDYA